MEKNIKMRIIRNINSIHKVEKNILKINSYGYLKIILISSIVLLFSWFIYNYIQRILKKKRDVITS